MFAFFDWVIQSVSTVFNLISTSVRALGVAFTQIFRSMAYVRSVFDVLPAYLSVFTFGLIILAVVSLIRSLL